MEAYTEMGKSFPRIRGDVPADDGTENEDAMFSPHTRGCSSGLIAGPIVHGVFPAYAGMFRWGITGLGSYRRFPRIRGDVP